jgi:hypothetical protein
MSKGWDTKNDRVKNFRKYDQYPLPHRKMLAYFESLMQDATFQQRLIDIRRKLNLPDNGLDQFVIKKGTEDSDSPLFDYPEVVYTREFEEELQLFLESYGFGDNWGFQFTDLIVYDNFDIIEYSNRAFEVWDIAARAKYEETRPHRRGTFMAHSSRTHPVAIFLHPYATKNDIIDFIRKDYKDVIEPKLKEHRKPEIKLGKVRKPNRAKQGRDRYILKLHKEGLSAREIVKAIFEQYGGDVMDYNYIYKIIRKKRGGK